MSYKAVIKFIRRIPEFLELRKKIRTVHVSNQHRIKLWFFLPNCIYADLM